ncbi:MAG: hypothetical protein HY699_00315 [Deltaproteobacteria bacterium]|nr:hypothetical protein [Deltaproteobacteria bacterium]
MLAVGLILGVSLPASAATTWNVPGDSSNTCTTLNPSCDTIAGAVAAASSGDTIQIAAGTFPVTSTITIGKNLTINGAGAGSTTIAIAFNTSAGSDNPGAAAFIISSGYAVDFNAVTVDGTGYKVFQGIRYYGSGAIDQCAFSNIKYEPSGPAYVGIGVAIRPGSPGADVTNSTFTQIGRIGVHYRAGTATCSGNTFTGKGAGNWLDYGIELGSGAVVAVSDNTISGNVGVASVDGSTSAGILITTYFGPGTSGTLTGNTISGCTAGVAAGYDGFDTSTVVAHGNGFAGNDFGIVSTAPSVNAEGNWWGSATGPTIASNAGGTGDATDDLVDYSPWLGSGDASGAAGFQQAAPADYVVNANVSPAYTAGGIQDGVDYASAGDTVSAVAGTYIENVLIDKALTLAGAGQGVSTIEPAASSPNPCAGSSLCGLAASNIILVEAADVTIHDFTLDGDNPALTSGVVSGGADVDARNGIIHNYYAGDFDNLTVHHVTAQNIYLRGIYSTGGMGFYFHHNIVENVQGEAGSIALFNFGGGGTFAYNTVSDANDAIASNWSAGTDYLNNTITNSSSGVHTDNATAADLLQGNDVSNCASGGYGVWTFVPSVAPSVDNNTITNCAVGLAAAGAGPAAVFTDNVVDATGQAGSVGAYVTTSQFGWGSGSVNASFTGNRIVNTDFGFYLEEEPGYTLAVGASCNQIAGNGIGIAAGALATPASAAFNNNSIIGNTVGADGTAIPSGDLDASGNWWGCVAGPGAPCNPVTTGVDAASPLSTPPSCSPCTAAAQCEDANPCTVDTCSTTCANTPGNSGTECRASAGPCDVAESCDGSNAACPSDGKSTALCRAAAGVCDADDYCDGVSDTCPSDAKGSWVCRAVAGPCDVAESCDGVGDNCPADTFALAATECRAVAGSCDVAENCTGLSASCPTDTFLSASTECRASAGICDDAENCTGSSAACPGDAKSTAVCRAAAGECDEAESCDGASDTCPSDAFVVDGTGCGTNTCLNTCQSGACTPGYTASCCGNTTLEVGEQCDDGNQVASDGCGAACRYELIPGDGDGSGFRNQRACLLEWSVVNAVTHPRDRANRPNYTQRCTNNDPACDFDLNATNNTCEFKVTICLNNIDANLAACPQLGVADPVRVVLPSAARDAANRTALTNALLNLRNLTTGTTGLTLPINSVDTGVCTPPFAIRVPLRQVGTRRYENRIRLMTLSRSFLTSPRWLSDFDALTLICKP